VMVLEIWIRLSLHFGKTMGGVCGLFCWDELGSTGMAILLIDNNLLASIAFITGSWLGFISWLLLTHQIWLIRWVWKAMQCRIALHVPFVKM